MSKNQNKFPAISYPGIGLVLGMIIGITFGPALFDEYILGLVLGSTFGLIFGSVAYILSKAKSNDSENDES